MRKLAIFCVLFIAAAAQGSIIGYQAADDGDGVITCQTGFDYGTYDLSIDGIHHQLQGQELYGHVVGSFTTDTELDPTVTMMNSIDNDTDFVWTDYHISISMNKSFTISNAAVSNPGNWSTVVAQPTLVGGQYLGTIDYYAGSPIGIGGTLDFGYKISFLGSVQFCQEMFPTPEPATLVLLALGGLVLRRRR